MEIFGTLRGTCGIPETIYSTRRMVPQKISILSKVNAIIEYHHVRGLVGLLERCRFLFNTSLSSFLDYPLRQLLLCLSTISSARTFSVRQTMHSIISTDSLLLYRIVRSRLITSLKTFNDSPTLRTTTFSSNRDEDFLEIETDPPTKHDQHHDSLF